MRIEDRLKQSDSILGNRGNSSLLSAQWRFDKEIVGRSLNSVSSSFPHYSLHDVSHSESILLEIEKILGDYTGTLSFVDCWLLLEAAYWHDLGMVVTYEEKHKFVNTPEFQSFLEQLCEHPGDMGEYAKKYTNFLHKNDTLNFVEIESAFRFIFAEYIRKVHPQRSKDKLLNPEALGISSPRTGLINSRLFLILGDILETHGMSNEAILKLPFENDGLDADDVAHPRFIAALLRLGDLLDLDDGRHCPTLLSTIGVIPELSRTHLRKHRSITSKVVNQQTIDIHSICEDYDSFEAQNDWFAFIEQEVEFQDRNWGRIAPKNYLKKLPTIEGLRCEIKGHLSLFNRSSRLRLDSNRIYEYINGDLLYSNPLACINELLQNASDAICDRIWMEKGKEISTIDDFREFAKQHLISVRVDTKKLEDKKKVQYDISIHDTGKGLSLNEIKSLTVIASSTNQAKKRALRAGMPEWMKPSGFFGIGMQSVFSMTDTLRLSTRSSEDVRYLVTLKSTRGRTPSIVVKQDNSTDWSFGTTVMFSTEDDLIPNSFSGTELAMKLFSEFDPAVDEVLKIKEALIESEVTDFANYSEFKITFNGAEIQNRRKDFKILDIQVGLEYSVEFVLGGGRNTWHYRGRQFKSDFHFEDLGVFANILSGTADTFLSLDRERCHKEGRNLIEEIFVSSILNNPTKVIDSVQNKELASVFYLIHDKEIDSNWKQALLSNHQLGSLVEVGAEYFIAFDVIRQDKLDIQEELVVIRGHDGGANLLLKVLLKLGRGLQIDEYKEIEVTDSHINRVGKKRIYKVKVTSSIDTSYLSENVMSRLSDDKLYPENARYWVPCGASQFSDISIPVQNLTGWIRALTPFSDFFLNGILLRSTQKTLQDDIETLSYLILKSRPELSKSQVLRSLGEFYEKHPFEVQPERHFLF